MYGPTPGSKVQVRDSLGVFYVSSPIVSRPSSQTSVSVVSLTSSTLCKFTGVELICVVFLWNTVSYSFLGDLSSSGLRSSSGKNDPLTVGSNRLHGFRWNGVEKRTDRRAPS